jgi:hypothetical protein
MKHHKSGWWGKKKGKKKTRKRGDRGRERRKKIEKRRYFGTYEKNKYIKKWNSNVKIGSLV